MGGSGVSHAKSAPVVLIRCNAGSYVGMGHFVRSRELSRLLRARGYQVVLCGPPKTLQQEGDDSLFCAWIPRPNWQTAAAEARFVLDLAKRWGSRHAIIDDYRSDGRHQLLLRHAGMRVLQQYDASRAQRFAAQLVVNASPAKTADVFHDAVICSDVEFLHGPRYSVLRSDFLTVAPRSPARPARRILVSYGGGDDRGAVLTALAGIVPILSGRMEVVIMIGAQNPRREAITAWITAHGRGRVALTVAPPNVPGLMVDCDLALLGGGTTTFEAAYCGLPMILSPIATNQIAQGEGWQAVGAAYYLGPMESLAPSVIGHAVADLLADPLRLAAMARAGQESVDGQGSARLLDALLEGSA